MSDRRKFVVHPLPASFGADRFPAHKRGDMSCPTCAHEADLERQLKETQEREKIMVEMFEGRGYSVVEIVTANIICLRRERDEVQRKLEDERLTRHPADDNCTATFKRERDEAQKERDVWKAAFWERLAYSGEVIQRKNEAIDATGAAVNRNADSFEEAMRQRDEVRKKLKQVHLYCTNVDSSSEGAVGVVEDILDIVEADRLLRPEGCSCGDVPAYQPCGSDCKYPYADGG